MYHLTMGDIMISPRDVFYALHGDVFLVVLIIVILAVILFVKKNK